MTRRPRTLALVGAALFVGMLATATGANAGNVDRATGGGQILVGTHGAGTTIAFTARGTATDAKGQVQVVDRSAGTGQSQVKFHGVVDCIEATVDEAEVIGHRRGAPADMFSLYVMDNGEGAAADNDLIFFNDVNPDATCGLDNDDDDGAVDLARGNAQVFDAGP